MAVLCMCKKTERANKHPVINMEMNNKLKLITYNCKHFALSSILIKILDWIIVLKEHKSLSSSPLQIGFKKCLSTTQCTHSLLEIVDYYNYNKSDIFVLMLDVSKDLIGLGIVNF